MSDDCDEALAKIYVYLDGELDAESVEHVRRHLADCTPCGDSYQFEERLLGVIRARMREGLEDVPPAFVEQLRLVLDAERTVEP